MASNPKPNSPSMVTIIVNMLLLVIPSSAKLGFNLTSFDPNNHDLNYSGDATPSSPDVQLTRNQIDKGMNGSTGRVTYPKLFRLWDKASGEQADFTTRFSFTINSGDQPIYGDGIAFFLAPDGFAFPSKQEGSGIGLVSGNQTLNSSSNPFVAVEFDTYRNDWDPIGDHVGINVNSMVSVANLTWRNLVSSGKMNGARVSYNSSAKKLSVSFTCYDEYGDVFIQGLRTEVDLKKYLPEWVCIGFSASTGDYFEIHTLHSWDFNSSLPLDEGSVGDIGANIGPTASEIGPTSSKTAATGYHTRLKSALGLGLGLGLSVCALFCGFFVFGPLKKRIVTFRKKDGGSPEFEIETGPKKFSYKELAVATKNFADELKIGQGGFGGVYKGFMKDLSSYVAVKKISSGSKQGLKEYAAELKTISRLRHRNLVQLIGWCHEGRELVLVYEFMPNGSLDSHLFKGTGSLNWATRYNIARGLASSLLYLHEEWEQCVLHRDIKSSNVMLDSGFNAKLGDFGLARLVDHEKGSQTTLLAGTMGYLAPECVLTGKAGKVSDVYSFGIVALELATGMKPIDPTIDGHIRLVDQVWGLYGTGRLTEAADPNLGTDFDVGQMELLMIVGLWCAYPNPDFRPTIKHAIQVLSLEAPVPNLPKTVPVATFGVNPINMDAFWGSESFELTGSGRGYNMGSGPINDTNSSKLTGSSSSASSSASLLSGIQ